MPTRDAARRGDSVNASCVLGRRLHAWSLLGGRGSRQQPSGAAGGAGNAGRPETPTPRPRPRPLLGCGAALLDASRGPGRHSRGSARRRSSLLSQLFCARSARGRTGAGGVINGALGATGALGAMFSHLQRGAFIHLSIYALPCSKGLKAAYGDTESRAERHKRGELGGGRRAKPDTGWVTPPPTGDPRHAGSQEGPRAGPADTSAPDVRAPARGEGEFLHFKLPTCGDLLLQPRGAHTLT